MKERKALPSHDQHILPCFPEDVIVLKAVAGQQVGELLFVLFVWVRSGSKVMLRLCSQPQSTLSQEEQRVCSAGRGKQRNISTSCDGVFCFDELFPDFSQPPLLLYW